MGSVAEKAVDTLPVRLAIGLMSGTSLDGIDAALIETDGEHHIRPIAFRSEPYSEQARRQLEASLLLTGARVRQRDDVIGAILTNASLAAMDIADGASSPSVAPLLEELELSAQRAAVLYSQIRDFSD